MANRPKTQIKEPLAIPDGKRKQSPPRLFWRNFLLAVDEDRMPRRRNEFKCESTGFPFTNMEHIQKSSSKFKEYQESTKSNLGSHIFWNSLKQSRDVYIWDKFFDSYCFKRLFDELEEAKEAADALHYNIRVFTKERTRDLSIPDSLKSQVKIFEFGRNKGSGELIHDRIALLDNAIWHSGATTAGMHPYLATLSGPWEDEEGKLKVFFEYLERKFNK